MVAQGDYKKVLDVVAAWPAEDRLALARDLLSISASLEPNPTPWPSFSDAYGMLRSLGKPAPTDEEVDQWIHEHRMQKYGQ